ncbi:hypothetical protein [Deinococcus sp.]|uniref:hypothetical protein n=1 Tax=Deinococcus sp. TaxID=47478 RepID=UPI0025CD57AF|nr:hypothetical protein [Deinococcus sp.]
MATPVFVLTVQSLSTVVSGRAAETLLLSALRDLDFSPDTVTAREMQRVLSGPLERRISQIMPGTSTLDNLRTISRRLAQLDPKAPTLSNQNARTVIWDQEDGKDTAWSDNELEHAAYDPSYAQMYAQANTQPYSSVSRQPHLMAAPSDRPGQDAEDSTASLMPKVSEAPFGNPTSSAVLGRNPAPSVPVSPPAELTADFRADVFGDEDAGASLAAPLLKTGVAAPGPAVPTPSVPAQIVAAQTAVTQTVVNQAAVTQVPGNQAPGEQSVGKSVGKQSAVEPQDEPSAENFSAENFSAENFSADDFEFSDPDYNHLQAAAKRYDLTSTKGQDALLSELARHAGVQTVVLCTTSGQVLNVRAPQGAPQLGSVVAATALLLRQRELRLISANLGSATVCMRVVGSYCVALLARGDINVGRLLGELQQIEVAA